MALQEGGSEGVVPNQLIITLQPDEGVSLKLGPRSPAPRCASGR